MGFGVAWVKGDSARGFSLGRRIVPVPKQLDPGDASVSIAELRIQFESFAGASTPVFGNAK